MVRVWKDDALCISMQSILCLVKTGRTLWPSVPSCVDSPFSQNLYILRDARRGLHGSDLFVHWTEIWGMWKTTDHLRLIIMLLKQFQKRFCTVPGWFILPLEPTAIMEYQGVYSLQLGRWNVPKEGTCGWQDPRFPNCTLPKVSLSLPQASEACTPRHPHDAKVNVIHHSLFNLCASNTSTQRTIYLFVAWCPRCQWRRDNLCSVRHLSVVMMSRPAAACALL